MAKWRASQPRPPRRARAQSTHVRLRRAGVFGFISAGPVPLRPLSPEAGEAGGPVQTRRDREHKAQLRRGGMSVLRPGGSLGTPGGQCCTHGPRKGSDSRSPGCCPLSARRRHAPGTGGSSPHGNSAVVLAEGRAWGCSVCRQCLRSRCQPSEPRDRKRWGPWAFRRSPRAFLADEVSQLVKHHPVALGTVGKPWTQVFGDWQEMTADRSA